MTTQIFGCPNCNQRFQVLPEQAGQIVQCPACSQKVGIPAGAFSAAPTSPAPSNPPSSPPGNQVHRCQHCQGQFGVSPDMIGMKVGCPHCQQAVLIQSESPIDPHRGVEDLPIKINIELDRPTATQNPVRSVDPAELLPPVKVGNPKTSPHAPNPEQKLEVKAELKPEAQPRHSNESKARKLPRSLPILESMGLKTPGINTPPEFKNADEVVDEQQLSSTETQSSAASTPVEQPTLPIAHLLPPRFDFADPTQLRTKNSAEHKIYLPDGSGGIQQLDQRVVRIEHGGEKITLVARSPQQKLRRRIISNIIAMIVGIGILALTFRLLT